MEIQKGVYLDILITDVNKTYNDILNRLSEVIINTLKNKNKNKKYVKEYLTRINILENVLERDKVKKYKTMLKNLSIIKSVITQYL